MKMGYGVLLASCGCAVIAGLTLFAASAAAEEDGPEQTMEQCRILEKKAREMKMAGNHEEARAAMREACELRRKMAQSARGCRPRPSSREHRAMIQRRLDEARGRLQKAEEAGKGDQAEAARRQIAGAEKELALLDKKPEREQPAPPDRPGADAENRLRHLREAMTHLRAAGMNDAADKLAREADSMEQKIRAAAQAHGPFVPPPDVERMRSELNELRQTVRKLQARVDELGRERTSPKGD